MGRRGRDIFGRGKPKNRKPKFRSGQPIRRGQALGKQCPLCGYGKNYRDLCTNESCAGSRPKPTSNPRASDMVERSSGLWVPPWHEGAR